ncbi:MAG: lipopolysaccharide biosynthesis protein [Bifidobacteriaceae bacterium]|nr:lipopolysaccharide biosynthesis protein [Bifidobacteriaceae bacterium]
MSTALRSGARGAGASLVGQFGRVAIHFFGTIALTRLLLPEDFGLVAMVAVFVALSELIRDFGMSTSGIQAQHLSAQQASNLFWANVVLGALGGLLLVGLTPLVVALYGEPRLGTIIPWMAAATLLNGAQAQLQVQLVRAMRFVAVVVSDCLAWGAGYGFAIVGAANGMGYWALAIQPLVVACVMVVSRWWLTRFRPQKPRHLRSSTALFRAGGHYGLSSLLQFAASNADTMVIGARFGSTPLGYYNRAFQLLLAPQAALLSPMTNVVIPTLRKASQEGRDRQALLVRLQSLVGFPVAIVFLAIAGCASPLIDLLFGADWAETGTLLRILALGGVFWTLNTVNYWAFVSSGKSRGLLQSNAITKSITVAAVVLFSLISTEAVAWAFSISTGLTWLIALRVGQRHGALVSHDFVRGGIAILAPACVTYGVCWVGAPYLSGLGALVGTIAGALGAVAVFFVLSMAWGASRRALRAAFRDARTAVRSMA